MAQLKQCEKNSCGRSIVFAARWFAAPAVPTKLVGIDSGFRRIFLSGKNNGVVPRPLGVMPGQQVDHGTVQQTHGRAV